MDMFNFWNQKVELTDGLWNGQVSVVLFDGGNKHKQSWYLYRLLLDIMIHPTL